MPVPQLLLLHTYSPTRVRHAFLSAPRASAFALAAAGTRLSRALRVVGAREAVIAGRMEDERFHREAIGFGVDGAQDGGDLATGEAFDWFARARLRTERTCGWTTAKSSTAGTVPRLAPSGANVGKRSSCDRALGHGRPG